MIVVTVQSVGRCLLEIISSMTLLVSISGLFLTVALLISKIQYPSTHFLLALHAVLGVFESAAMAMLLIDLHPAKQIDSTIKTLLLVAIGALILINFLASFVQVPYLLADEKVKKWLKGHEEKCSCNLFWFSLTVIAGIFLNYKAKLLIFSRLFGFQCYKCKLETVEKFKIFNVFAFLGLLPEVMALYCAFTVITAESAKNDRFFVMLDAIIILVVNLLLTVAVVPKDQSFFHQEVSGVTCGKVSKVVEESLVSALASNFEDGTMSCLPEITQVDESQFVTTKRRKKPRAKKLMAEIKEDSFEDKTEMTASMLPEEADRSNTQSQEFASRFSRESSTNPKNVATADNIFMVDSNLMQTESDERTVQDKQEVHLNSKREEVGIECPQQPVVETSNKTLTPREQRVEKITVIVDKQPERQPQAQEPGIVEYLLQDQRKHQETQRIEAQKIARVQVEEIDDELETPQDARSTPKAPVIKPLQIYELNEDQIRVPAQQQEQEDLEPEFVYDSQRQAQPNQTNEVFFAIEDADLPEPNPRESPLSDYHVLTPANMLQEAHPVQPLSRAQMTEIETARVKETYPSLGARLKNKKRLSPEQMAKHQSGNIHLNFSASNFEPKADEQNKPIRKKSWEKSFTKSNYPLQKSPQRCLTESDGSEQEDIVSPRKHLKTQELTRKGKEQLSKRQSLIQILQSRRRELTQETDSFKEFRRTGNQQQHQKSMPVPNFKKHSSTQESSQFVDQATIKPSISHSLQPLKPVIPFPKTTSPKKLSSSKQKSSTSITKSHMVFRRSFKDKVKEMSLQGRSASLQHHRKGSGINKEGLNEQDKRKMTSLEQIYLQRLLK